MVSPGRLAETQTTAGSGCREPAQFRSGNVSPRPDSRRVLATCIDRCGCNLLQPRSAGALHDAHEHLHSDDTAPFPP